MATVSTLAVAASAAILLGTGWVATILVLGRGSNDASGAYSLLCLPGIGLVGIGLVLAVLNGLVVVLP